ncbi:hypothetical protein EON64_12580 [archaeon]|nr:MAG: hypothetical protein EON64_12580 [archaeon]
MLVLHDYAGPEHGHLAVVRNLINGREIRVDHANWLNDGSVFVNNPVMDVSEGNDWTKVRVWNIQTGAWGGKVYPVQGFIGPEVVSPALLSSLKERVLRIAGYAPTGSLNHHDQILNILIPRLTIKEEILE